MRAGALQGLAGWVARLRVLLDYLVWLSIECVFDARYRAAKTRLQVITGCLCFFWVRLFSYALGHNDKDGFYAHRSFAAGSSLFGFFFCG